MEQTGPLQTIMKILPLLIPVVIIEFGLLAIALVDLIRRERTRGPKWVWALVIVLFQLFGPIAYFVLGREE